MNEASSIARKGQKLTKIIDKNQRNVTFCKRKRGLLKKTIEMSVLCGQDILLVMFDREKQKLYEYKSSEEFDARVVRKLLSPDTRMQFHFEQYSNNNYNSFVNDKGERGETASYFDTDECKKDSGNVDFNDSLNDFDVNVES